MDHVHAHNEGDAKARFLHGNILEDLNLIHALQIEYATQLSAGDARSNLSINGSTSDNIFTGWCQVQLSQFFFQCHFLEQLVDKLVHV